MSIYECVYPHCGSQCGQADTPPCAADHANRVAEIQRSVGAAMITITTTVHGMDEWPAIPHIWQLVAEERDNLKAQVAHMKAEADALRGNWR